jgi:hypothetical protein
MDDQLFNIIGKLYVEALNCQKVIELLQNRLSDRDKEIQELRNKTDQILNDK